MIWSRLKSIPDVLGLARARDRAAAPPPVGSSPAPPPELTKRYPHWFVLRSQLRGYWACSTEQPVPSGATAYLSADTLDELVEQLDEQERLRGRGQA